MGEEPGDEIHTSCILHGVVIREFGGTKCFCQGIHAPGATGKSPVKANEIKAHLKLRK